VGIIGIFMFFIFFFLLLLSHETLPNTSLECLDNSSIFYNFLKWKNFSKKSPLRAKGHEQCLEFLAPLKKKNLPTVQSLLEKYLEKYQFFQSEQLRELKRNMVESCFLQKSLDLMTPSFSTSTLF
jgi:hypothetical protein